ncbi:MAG: PaaI family thioesterase [Acidobacteria bacterium]|nr:PaaI family thioesterase [Acidobacteriota bacterium]
MAKPLAGRKHTSFARLQKDQCFVCGKNNPAGMRLKFVRDKKRNSFLCRFRLDDRYTGPPGHCHGGIIATILDEAMGKVNKLRQVVAVTSQISVDYLKPVPLHKPLQVRSREIRVQGRRHFNMAEIVNADEVVLARSRGLFIAIDPVKMFARFAGKTLPGKQK